MYFNFSAASHTYSARHDRFSGMQNKYFKGIPLLIAVTEATNKQHSLTLLTFLYLVVLKKFQFSQSFLPRFNMDFYGDRP